MDELTLREIARGLRDRQFSSTDLVEHFLARIAADSTTNAFITVTEQSAREQARRADQRLSDASAGPSEDDAMLGIPIAHKDIFCTDGVRTTCGSKMLADFVAPYDAAVVSGFNAAASPMLGKTNMDEFAMGSSNETSFFGPVLNPWNSQRVAGGSSGGSAAAVAAGLAPLATATDTGGSIRLPAAFCGVSGLKPTYGRVSRYGMIAFASSFDQGGLIARQASDIAWALSTMAGFDPRDSTCADAPVPNYSASLDNSLANLRVGIPRQFMDGQLDAQVADQISSAIKVLETLGAQITDVDLPNTKATIPTYYILAPAECSSNLSRFDGVRFGYRDTSGHDIDELYERSRAEGFGDEVKRRIMLGTYALSTGYYDAYYRKAQEVRRIIANDYAAAFADVDVLVGPTAPGTAFEVGARTDDPVGMYLTDIYTTGANLAGLPAMSIPAGFVDAMPVGLHLIGNHFCEAQLLNVAHQFQNETDWHTRRPPAIGAST
ncbi:MAG: Asp-tRNA(Asn)/Glu-tRNA(Gln) amidotransferase subunit GatA [Gammaproteobacteria bacterium]|nr:Asp-tRNA(Asn)/Glu-tRNA(Gln) amidotransferase subunit GatA [Gammaproteobacteria bacterium]